MKKKNRRTKVIEIVALIITILALLMGFIAFFNSYKLEIEEEPIIKPNDEDFNIVFTPTEQISGDITSGVVGISSTGESVGKATIVQNEKGTIANVKVKFTNPGQEVVYTFYSHNKGKYEAYLDTITYADVSGVNNFKKCLAVDYQNTNKYLLSSACESISMVVQVGDNVVTNGSITNIKNHKLGVNASEKVTITIKYDSNGTLVDGDFTVDFGLITLTYLSKAELEAR